MSTWKKILQCNYKPFVEWLNKKDYRNEYFNIIANSLEEFIISTLKEPEDNVNFLRGIEPALKSCNDEIYDNFYNVHAYIHLHFLERYNRFWDVLLELLKAGTLPMRQKGINVMDIGTGPGPTLYALQDFYKCFTEYANEMGIGKLKTPEPQIDFIESSQHMSRFIHYFSEINLRSGPFHPLIENFEGLDFKRKRQGVYNSYIAEIEDEDWIIPKYIPWWLSQNEPWIHDLYHYNFVILSNFLTKKNQTEELESEIDDLFSSLRYGGVIIVVGAHSGEYPTIYARVDDLARKNRINRIICSETINCIYGDSHSKRIKLMYANVWDHIINKIDENEDFMHNFKNNVPAEIYDASKEIKGPEKFGLRVYRKGKF